MPKRFRDLLPQSGPCLPTPPSLAASPAPPANVTTLQSRVCQIFRTPKNIFGLVRQYFGLRLPLSDPEELVTLEDLSSTTTPAGIKVNPPHNSSPFYPFPNESSFRLGDWYWNGGVQKSQQCFKDLVDIVGDPTFNPSDIRHTKWDRINATLAGDKEADSEDEGHWMDAEDAGWTKTPVKISVPFHSRMKNPGPRDYVGAELYHRSLVSVIKERVTDPHAGPRLHMVPYELLWQPAHLPNEVKMYGELYTSQAFLEAHRALQDSPGEPGCDLERVVIALMLWSDSTHLTSFGDSHLWPLYLYIGNESKYRRCKPSCNLCSHVAYFEKVG
jgi:hypothetical protein